MIKIQNFRRTGSLFHYAHFICDCLFTEVVNDIFMYKIVIRKKNIDQTIGNFYKIYNEVMKSENRELLEKDYNKLDVDTIALNKDYYCNKINFEKFRNYIFSRYNIDHLKYNTNYPNVILIKRGERKKLIDDPYLSERIKNITTGRERRHIKDIKRIENYLQNKYNSKFKSLYFEDISFEEQVKHFNNAKLIICAHGAVMSNMFFCKKNTYLIEVTCNNNGFYFFDQISKILNINNIKCRKNKYENIVNLIDNIDL